MKNKYDEGHEKYWIEFKGKLNSYIICEKCEKILALKNNKNKVKEVKYDRNS